MWPTGPSSDPVGELQTVSLQLTDAHPLHRHDERRPLVILRVDPVDLCPVGQCLRHVRQAASARGPVELQTWTVLLGLVEDHVLARRRRRQSGRHGNWRRLGCLCENTFQTMSSVVRRNIRSCNSMCWNLSLCLTCIGDTIARGSVGQLLPAAVGAVLDAAVCTFYCESNRKSGELNEIHLSEKQSVVLKHRNFFKPGNKG